MQQVDPFPPDRSFAAERISSDPGIRGQPLTVSQLNRRVADLLAGSLPLLSVRGELSNLTRAASGHWYFTLKDAGAQVRCVMFRNRAQYVPFAPREGLAVEISAQVSLYQARGDFQLQVDAMRAAGAGDLYQQFLQLKDKLQREGLFDEARKRPLPVFPRGIAVVTSPSGAALHDVLTTLSRRAPWIPVTVVPAQVQGTGSAEQLLGALTVAQQLVDIDVILLVRGGGAIEDLWSFNDERLARAIAQSQKVVVSGVGHETDFTIADFVADRRAPTPTAAAALASPDRRELGSALHSLCRQFMASMQRALDSREQQLDYAVRGLRPPSAQWRERAQRLDNYVSRLHSAGHVMDSRRRAELHLARARLRLPRIDLLVHRLEQAGARLTRSATHQLESWSTRLEHRAAALHQASPATTLARGYAVVRTASGAIVRSEAQLSVGQSLSVTLAQAEVGVTVDSIKAESRS